jgi:hypothetical protein
VYVAVPPAGVTVADPLLSPLQETFVLDDVALKAIGWVIVTFSIKVHPFASVMVQE